MPSFFETSRLGPESGPDRYASKNEGTNPAEFLRRARGLMAAISDPLSKNDGVIVGRGPRGIFEKNSRSFHGKGATG
jgi:hypothetical protein